MEQKPKNIAYIRVSTHKQDEASQRLAILNYARDKKINIDDFISVQVSSRKSTNKRKIDQLWEKLKPEDTLIVSELSRLGRSLGQIITIVDRLVKENINFVALKEDIRINGKQNIQTKVMITMFALFADIERDLISQRTKQGLLVAKLRGRLPGRPKGAFGDSMLNGKEKEIKALLDKGVSKSSIAKIIGSSRTTLFHFIKSRELD